MKDLRIAGLVTVPLAVALLLTGCGASGGPGTMHHDGASVSASGASVDMADSMFVTMMIPHHEQAIEMSDILLAKTDVDEDVAELAEQIKAAQGPEIELMEGWLEDWGMPHPDSMGDMGHGDGMMSAEDMDALEAADGAEASRLYLEQMIVHHEGAIDMAEAELAAGENADVLALAQEILDAQTAEIETMRSMLAQR